MVGCNASERARERFQVFLNIGITEEQIEETFVIHNESLMLPFDFKIRMLEYIGEKWNELQDEKVYHDSIPDLKKKIKHSKNPMEKKMLEKKLNDLYKERRMKY